MKKMKNKTTGEISYVDDEEYRICKSFKSDSKMRSREVGKYKIMKETENFDDLELVEE